MHWEGGQSAGRFAGLLSLVALALTLALASLAVAGSRVVHVVPVRGEVDAGLAAFVDRAVSEAEDAGAQALVLDIDTLGGRVDAAVLIRDRLLRARVPTVAFIHPRAISAGALIALASERIAVAGGATIGAAAPVEAAPGAAPRPAGEKVTSYLRKEFRATAEQRGRPPEIAEAMVDADVAIPGLVAEGKLLTLTTWEALTHRIADFRADDMAGVLRHLGLETAELHRSSPNWAERLVGFLALPMVGSLLLSVGTLALATLLAIAGGVVLLRALPHLPFGRRIILKTGLGEGGWDARPRRGAPIQAGARGIALSPLRPAGVAEIAGKRTDVVSDGEYVPSGEPIEVIRLDENRIVVRRAPPPRGQVG